MIFKAEKIPMFMYVAMLDMFRGEEMIFHVIATYFTLGNALMFTNDINLFTYISFNNAKKWKYT